VFLGKHFFRYRFDYREEWLKFTATLSSQDHPQEAGKNVIRGLADMLESPAGGLWLLRPDDDQYRQAARWNLPAATETVDKDGALPAFMRSTAWVVNLKNGAPTLGATSICEYPVGLPSTRRPGCWCPCGTARICWVRAAGQPAHAG
jgi:hypothetical protein